MDADWWALHKLEQIVIKRKISINFLWKISIRNIKFPRAGRDGNERWSTDKLVFLPHAVGRLRTATSLSTKDKAICMATLRSIMGKECLRIFQTLPLFEEEKKEPKTMLDGLYFKPTHNVVYETYVFYTCIQGANESLNQYVMQLRHLAKSCNFAALEDNLIVIVLWSELMTMIVPGQRLVSGNRNWESTHEWSLALTIEAHA